MAHLEYFTKPLLTILFFLLFTLLISSTNSQQAPPPLTPTSTDPTYYYNLCAPSTCNNISLPYPFALPTPCHASAINVSCPSNEYFLLASSRTTDTIRVLSINYSDPTAATLSVASNSLFTCGVPVSKPNYVIDSTIFLLHPNYNPGTHLNCTSPIPSNAIRGLQNASCLGCNTTSNICYYTPFYDVSYANCEIFHVFTPKDSFNVSNERDLRAYLRSGFEIRFTKPSECRGCEGSGGRCGNKPSTGSFVCFCPTSVHSFNCSDGFQEDLSTWVNSPGGGGSGPSRAVIAVISASASLLCLVVLVALVVILARRKKFNFHFDKRTMSSVSPKRYSYSQLKKLTYNFSSKIGEGGFGTVYKGTIQRNGVEVPVAVKILKRSKQTQKQFMNEVATIGSVHHHNLVGMFGYCVDGDTHAVVYEFMENGSLDKYIYNIKKENVGPEVDIETEDKWLSPTQVCSIALETARGILYLHQGCRNRILHLDIKPPNVLLDSNFSAKVADFGLAKMIDKDRSHVSLTAAQGTPGYAAPEMWLKNFGPVTEKSDVYSYGMLLLEMVGRRKNYESELSESSQVYFPEWLYNKVEKDEFPFVTRREDNDVSFEIGEDEEKRTEEDENIVKKMCLVGLWCVQHIPSNRPSMDKVVQMLEGHVEIGIPPHPLRQKTVQSHERIFPDSLV
ncbi:hypothetical protein IFM89_022333 [Coptis chinensis]|uniref:non-specific serine/threonine protein kinase n=1 Tax=Coptis chinensis TaxID=261450 RepID=A0A835I683_9MAGN|nr:hypothetical protein IFM89_022333 [Coptis chinensis]